MWKDDSRTIATEWTIPLDSARPYAASLPCAQPVSAEYTSDDVRFATQPLVDRHGRVAAHELLFRWNSADQPVSPTLGAYATAHALSNALLDGEWLTRLPAASPSAPASSECAGACARPALSPLYVNMDEGFLLGPMADAITPAVGVIELLETVVPSPEVQRRVQALHQRGHRFSLDDVEGTDDPRWALAEYVESIKIDCMAAPRHAWEPLIRMARTAGLRVIVEKVETDGDISLLKALGADLFQGYGIERPTVHRVPALPGCNVKLMGRLYVMAEEGADVDSLAALAESDPAVVARLLRLQAIYCPQEVALSRDLAGVMRSLPRPVLVAWLAQLNVTALHGRGGDRVAGVRKQMAHIRSELAATGPADAVMRQQEAFERYRALVAHLARRCN